ncbi:outer membrane protein [Helicobacter cynogastricus]|uniref:outer membrane protein n=1 Tax=Helicobacter cynogastricus TaxID=329937 RepID=UPI001F2F438B|nr:outer membrane protein [Helicobacter cynogastricus]
MTTSVVKPISAQDLIQKMLQNRIRRYEEAGMTPEEAQRIAQGDLPRIEDVVKDAYPDGAPGFKDKTDYKGNLYGGDFQIGYKQFFGQSKRFGLRYYGTFSGQGGSYYDQDGRYDQPIVNLFFGAGVDVLFNFYDDNERIFGIFAGVMAGGNLWLMGEAKKNGKYVWLDSKGSCVSMNDHFKDLADNTKSTVGEPRKATFSPGYAQVIVNAGFRTNINKNQGFEFGVRIPILDYIIDRPYYKATITETVTDLGGVTTVVQGAEVVYTFRRKVALYVNYVYNF